MEGFKDLVEKLSTVFGGQPLSLQLLAESLRHEPRMSTILDSTKLGGTLFNYAMSILLGSGGKNRSIASSQINWCGFAGKIKHIQAFLGNFALMGPECVGQHPNVSKNIRAVATAIKDCCRLISEHQAGGVTREVLSSAMIGISYTTVIYGTDITDILQS
ncbi:hypothetical protein SUGI_0689180 [Cryptomeria japonica]|nr:hypothetical protein SUGI_0689180 [Cryptomeria japonica]